MKKNKIFASLLIFICLILILFFILYYIKGKNGNNISKSTEDIIQYILNINSYEAEIDVIVQSNKTTNEYKIKQYYTSPNICKQIIREPKDIENLTIIYDGKNIKVENSIISLSKIYKEYQYINQNTLFLNSFIENYNDYSKIEENNDEIIIQNNIKYNKYNEKQVLYVNKKTGLPTKLEIYDNNKNNTIYIKYNKVKFNKTKQEEILAFKFEEISL